MLEIAPQRTLLLKDGTLEITLPRPDFEIKCVHVWETGLAVDAWYRPEGAEEELLTVLEALRVDPTHPGWWARADRAIAKARGRS